MKELPYKELKERLLQLTLPESLQLDKCTFISNVQKFTESHFAILEANSGKRRFLPYYERLLKVYYAILNNPTEPNGTQQNPVGLM